MKHLPLYIAILSFTFVFGVDAAKFYVMWNQPSYRRLPPVIRDECRDGTNSFKLFEGKELSLFHAEFSSELAAQKCFQFKLQYVTKIIEREPLFDKASEQIVGQRVVALYNQTSASGVREAAIIFTLNKLSLDSSASTSLQHALTYDKQKRKD
jgi:hypothetical protein